MLLSNYSWLLNECFFDKIIFSAPFKIMGLTSPTGEKKYITGAFPSACGKTNLAMITPTIPGWKVECVGDDIAWMWFDEEGQLRAINPESGFFGVAPGSSYLTNPIAMKTFQKDTVFTNTAETSDGDFWWEGNNIKSKLYCMMKGGGSAIVKWNSRHIHNLLLPSHFEMSIFTFKGKISLNRVILDRRTQRDGLG